MTPSGHFKLLKFNKIRSPIKPEYGRKNIAIFNFADSISSDPSTPSSRSSSASVSPLSSSKEFPCYENKEYHRGGTYSSHQGNLFHSLLILGMALVCKSHPAQEDKEVVV